MPKKKGNKRKAVTQVAKKSGDVLILVGAHTSEPESGDLVPGKATTLDSMPIFWNRKEIKIDLNEAKQRWKEGLHTVHELIESSSEKIIEGWMLDEVSVGMTFTASGKLAFIAEAGLEASLHLVFKRRNES